MEIVEALIAKVTGLSEEQLVMMNGIYQFSLTGDAPVDCVLTVDNGVPQIVTGKNPDATVTIGMPVDDFASLVEGRLDAMGAFMSGRLWVNGAMDQAMKLSALFGM